MKKIIPIPIWIGGKILNAIFITAHQINDDMATQAGFYYALFASDLEDVETPGQKIIDGNLLMSGQDYQEWTGNNQDAFNWIFKQLNITLAV